MKLRCLGPLLIVLTFSVLTARGAVPWIPATASELIMTSEAKAPGASAILLSYEETDDGDTGEVMIHARIKILTSAGLSAAAIDLPQHLLSDDREVEEVLARTIHRDGVVVPFQGKPQRLVGEAGGRAKEVLNMPGAEVGSILEYMCHFKGENVFTNPFSTYHPPLWRVQRSFFVKSAHFVLKAPADLQASDIRWVATLPDGVALKHVKSNVTLDLTDIPAAPDEDMMPPPESVFYKVRFFFYDGTREKYWSVTGDRIDSVWSDFYKPKKNLTAAVHQMIGPGDTDEQALRKLYLAVMAMDNTDFTREHTRREDKQNGLREAQNSDDLWQRKRGDSWELTMLFIAMARAAGFDAYPMAVAARDRAPFDMNVLSWGQFDSMIAIVRLKERTVFFDPGTRYCPFARLAPWHANVQGVSSEGKYLKFGPTPGASFKTSLQQRLADITLSADGSVSGTVQMGWFGAAGVSTRLQGLREDQKEVESELERSVQETVPAGVELKLVSLKGLTDGEAPLLATFQVSGKLGIVTAKRIVLPSQFFAGAAKPMFAAASHSEAIYFPNSHQDADLLRLHLPGDLTVESLPETKTLHVDADTAYQSTAQTVPAKTTTAGTNAPGTNAPGATLTVQRVFSMDRIDYPVSAYPQLHAYFGQIAASDGVPIVLRRQTATASAGAP